MRTMNEFQYNNYTDDEFIYLADKDHPEVAELCRRLEEKLRLEERLDIEDTIEDMGGALMVANEHLKIVKEKIRKLELAAG